MADARPSDLVQLTRRLIEPVGFEDLVREIREAAVQRLQADRGTVFVFEDDTHELTAQTQDGEIRFNADLGLAGEALRTQQTIVVPDVSVDARFNREVDLKTGYTTRTLLTVPVTASDGQRLGLVQLLNKSLDGVPAAFGPSDATEAESFAALVAVAWQRSLLERDREQKLALERELGVARQIQEAMWPDHPPTPPGYALAGWCRPAEHAGGDAYDVAEAPDGALWLLLADATGHGVGPALAVAQVRSMFRMAARAALPLEQAMRHIDQQVCADMPLGRFVTAALARLEPDSGRLTYLSAGHGPAYLATPGAAPQELPTTGLPLGVSADVPHEPPVQRELAPGSFLVQFTDGLFESLDASGADIGLEPTLATLRDGGTGRDQGDGDGDAASGLLRALRGNLERHLDGHPLQDDVTLLVLQRGADG